MLLFFNVERLPFQGFDIHPELAHAAVDTGAIHPQNFSCATRTADLTLGFLYYEFNVSALKISQGWEILKRVR